MSVAKSAELIKAINRSDQPVQDVLQIGVVSTVLPSLTVTLEADGLDLDGNLVGDPIPMVQTNESILNVNDRVLLGRVGGKFVVMGTITTADYWHMVGAAGEVSFANAWGNFGAPYTPTSFWKDADNFVHLEGEMTRASASTTLAAFTLPTTHTPPTRKQFITPASSVANPARIDIMPNGDVLVTTTVAGATSLSGINFTTAI
jgi:hypothetical protein